ncbi:MAG TPA: hypothetical protein DCW94_01215 [Porticoccaceae bacterium]|nr:hypothetical protein [Porticoccaceae bacterium]
MRNISPSFLKLLFGSCLISPLSVSAGIVIDGVLDKEEWAGAEIYSDFVTVEPLTGDSAKYRTEVRVITNPEGIFVGFSNYQPASVKRVNRQFPRDAQIEADRNVVSIDFDSTALAGYDFTVGSANSQQDGIVTPGDYSGDWDGTWYSQTSSDEDYWYSEMHIPWTVAPMTDAGNGRKKIALWFSRVVFDESLRFAFPNAYYSRPTFMEDWHPLEVEQVSTSTLDWFPFLSFSSDLQNGASGNSNEEFNGGLDFIWRPNSSSQLTGAINPDFGQVESDDLVVNFSAFETFVTEKRPFFTENQSLFSSNIRNGDQTLYTRRIGAGPAGQGSGLVDIDLAAKVTHFGETVDLGLFVVREDDSKGSFGGDFLSSRVQRTVDGLTLGHRLTYAQRSILDREATVQVLDMIWRKDETTEFRGQILHADIQQQGNNANSQESVDEQDFAGWASWSYAPNDEWYHSVFLSHYGDQFNMNDMGYMKRNDFREFSGSTRHDRLAYKADSNILSSTTLFEYGYMENTQGDRLQLRADLDHTWTYKSTRQLGLKVGTSSSSWDDRLTRGNGLFAKPAGYWLETRYSSPRGNDLTFNIDANIEYDEIEKTTLSLGFSAQIYLNERVTLGTDLSYKNLQEWLIWDVNTAQLAGFEADRFNADLRFDWYPSARQEVRLKFQWVGIDAEQVDSYQLNSDGTLGLSPRAAEDFSLSDTALQMRYRYQLAPLSDIFLVYSRGGYFSSDDGDEGPGTLIREGWDGVQVESIIAKIRYRF